MALADNVKSLLLRLNKTKDLLGNLDKQVVKLQTQTPLDPYRKRDIVQLMKATASDSKSSYVDLMEEITKDISGVQPSPNRIAMYDTMLDIRRKMPILSRATRIWIDNILSPDDINKRALRVIIDDDSEIKQSEFTELIRKFRDYVKFLELEEKADGILTGVFFEGDRFVEIVTEDFMLATALKANDIKLKESIIPSDEIVEIEEGKQKIILRFIDTPDLLETDLGNGLRIDENNSLFELHDENTYTTFFTEADKKDDDKKKDKDKEDKKEDKPKEIEPDVYEKIPDDPFDVRIRSKKDQQIAIQDIRLVEHDPRNIVVLHKNAWVVGYLYIEQLSSDFSMSVISRKRTHPFADEQSASDQLIQKLYGKVRDYLSKRSIDEIPDDLKEVITRLIMSNPTKQINIRYIPLNNMQHFKYPSNVNDPYGESYFSDILYLIKLYLARLTSSTLYKLARVGKHLVFYIDVTNTIDARKRIETVKTAMKKREITADDLGTTETIPSIISTFEDFYIPTKNGQRMVDIDTLELGNMQDTTEGDNFYLKNILTGIEIPPSYLGIEEFNSTKSTLAQESMLFARSIIRMQKIFSEQFTELLHKVYRIIHFKKLDPMYLSIRCSFAPPSVINIENVSTYYNKVRGLREDLKEMGLPDSYIRKTYMPEIDWDAIMLQELQDAKEGGETESENLGFENPFEGGGMEAGGAGGIEEFGDMGGAGEMSFNAMGTPAGNINPQDLTQDFASGGQ